MPLAMIGILPGHVCWSSTRHEWSKVGPLGSNEWHSATLAAAVQAEYL